MQEYSIRLLLLKTEISLKLIKLCYVLASNLRTQELESHALPASIGNF